LDCAAVSLFFGFFFPFFDFLSFFPFFSFFDLPHHRTGMSDREAAERRVCARGGVRRGDGWMSSREKHSELGLEEKKEQKVENTIECVSTQIQQRHLLKECARLNGCWGKDLS
jgi:hypothetical protein